MTASILKHADTLESLSLASSLDNKDIFPEAAAYLIRRLPRLKVLDVDSTEVDREYLMRDAILSRPELEIIILVEPASLDDTWAYVDLLQVHCIIAHIHAEPVTGHPGSPCST